MVDLIEMLKVLIHDPNSNWIVILICVLLGAVLPFIIPVIFPTSGDS